MFPVFEFVQTNAFEFPLLSHWSHLLQLALFCILCHIIFVFLHLCILYLCRQRPLALLSPVIDPTLPGNSGDCLPLGPQQSTVLVKYEDNCTITQMKIQLHTYKSTVTFKIYICNYHLCRTESDCLSLTSAVDLSAE